MFLKFLLTSFFFASASVFGETLIIQSSDQHSSYSRLPHFLGSIEVIFREFKSQYPNGKTVLLINGDFSSHSDFWPKEDKIHFLNKEHNSLATEDRGTFAYKILAGLAKKHKLIYTFGNHDAFDFEDSDLFLYQMRILKEAGGNLIVANTDFYPAYTNIFSNYKDLQLSNKKKIRFIGFTLPGSQDKRFNSLTSKGPQVIKNITPINHRLMNLLSSSNKDSEVSSVVLSFHLGTQKTANIFEHFTKRELKKARVIFTGHDHMAVTKQIDHNKTLINSGSFYDFSSILLDDNGTIINSEFFNHKRQLKLFQYVKKRSLEYKLIEKSEEFIHRLEESKFFLSSKNKKQPIKKEATTLKKQTMRYANKIRQKWHKKERAPDRSKCSQFFNNHKY